MIPLPRVGAHALRGYRAASGSIQKTSQMMASARLYLADEYPEMGGYLSPLAFKGTTVTIHLYVPDVDAAFQRAAGAGAKVMQPLTDMLWGDRYGQVLDPFGHRWSLATHKEDVPPEEMARRAEAAMASMGPPPG